MSYQTALTLVIFFVALLALASQRLPRDLTALLVLLSLILTGILSPTEAFSAFGQPVIIIIPCIYIIGAALYETGVATMIANRLLRVSSHGSGVLTLAIMLTAGLMSALVSSLLVVAVLMPAVLRIARRERLAPSLLLLPLASAATMGNLLTLIGAVSNLVVSDLVAVSGYGPLGLFSVTPFGLVSLALSILWTMLVGRRLLSRELPQEPAPPSLQEVEESYQLDDQLYRLRVRSGSDLIAQRLHECGLSPAFGLNVMAVRPKGGRLKPANPDWVLEQDDLLVVEGSLGDVLQAASLHRLEPKGAMPLEEFNQLEEDTLRLAELIVPFRSQLVGRTLAEIHFRERYGLNVLAVHRREQAYHEDLPHLALAAGDTLLVQGSIAYLRQVGKDWNLISATQLGPQPGDLITRKAKLTLGLLAIMLICVVSGLLSLATASLAAALALILTGCLSVDRAYRSIDWSIVVLVGGMLPLAMALQQTGAAELIAGLLISAGGAAGPMGSLLLLYLFTTFISQVVSNSVSAALMVPIALNLATVQDLSPHLFAIAIAVAATTSYITPMTNADNLLIREPGRYSMRDYLVNNLPLYLLQTTVVMLILSALL